MAYKAGTDPIDFDLGTVTENSDTFKLLRKLKELSDWDKPLPKHRERGVAQWKFFGCQCGAGVVH
jgi:isoquinoline 1-oxidoreductase beta subunit